MAHFAAFRRRQNDGYGVECAVDLPESLRFRLKMYILKESPEKIANP